MSHAFGINLKAAFSNLFVVGKNTRNDVNHYRFIVKLCTYHYYGWSVGIIVIISLE